MNEEELRMALNMMEQKLWEYMTPEEYHKFSDECAKKILLESVNGMAESEFKNFLLENFEQITG